MKQFRIYDGKFAASVKVEWIPESKHSAAHYAAFISVPFKDSRWHNLFVYDRDQEEAALIVADDIARDELRDCTRI